MALGYNLIRLMMAQATTLADYLPRVLSFKHTLQLWIAWDHHGFGTDQDALFHGLFVLMPNNAWQPPRSYRTQSHQAKTKTFFAPRETARACKGGSTGTQASAEA